MEKKKDFIMVPRSIDKDERLDPWLQKHGVNRHALLWAVERMIDKLRMESKPMSVDDLLKGLNERHLPYKTLKEIVTMSGFFDCDGKKVRYNWKRFINEQPQEQSQDQLQEPSQMPSQCRLNAASMPSSTCARTSSSANRRVQYIETEKETEKKKIINKENPSGTDANEAAVHIHKIMSEYPFRDGELSGWGKQDDLEDRKNGLEKKLLWLADAKDSDQAVQVGVNLEMTDYKERWHDIVIAFVSQLNLTGYLSRVANYSRLTYYLGLFTEKTDKRDWAYQAREHILQELEEKRKAKIAVEKQRFPFEDYDPERGTRYVGNDLIPWDAPPRPDAVSTWDEEDRCWRSPAEVEERAQRSHARFLEMLKTYNESHGKPGGAELPG